MFTMSDIDILCKKKKKSKLKSLFKNALNKSTFKTCMFIKVDVCEILRKLLHVYPELFLHLKVLPMRKRNYLVFSSILKLIWRTRAKRWWVTSCLTLPSVKERLQCRDARQSVWSISQKSQETTKSWCVLELNIAGHHYNHK